MPCRIACYALGTFEIGDRPGLGWQVAAVALVQAASISLGGAVRCGPNVPSDARSAVRETGGR